MKKLTSDNKLVGKIQGKEARDKRSEIEEVAYCNFGEVTKIAHKYRDSDAYSTQNIYYSDITVIDELLGLNADLIDFKSDLLDFIDRIEGQNVLKIGLTGRMSEEEKQNVIYNDDINLDFSEYKSDFMKVIRTIEFIALDIYSRWNARTVADMVYAIDRIVAYAQKLTDYKRDMLIFLDK